MAAQIAALWAVAIIQLFILGLIVTKSGGLVELMRRSHRADSPIRGIVGRRLSPLRITPASHPGGNVQARRAIFHDGSLVVFVTTHCVASYRLLRFLSSKLEDASPEFRVTVALVNTRGLTPRVLGQFPVADRAIDVVDRRFSGRFYEALPFAIAFGEDNHVMHAEMVGNEAAFATFIDACGSREIRRWFSASAANHQDHD